MMDRANTPRVGASRRGVLAAAMGGGVAGGLAGGIALAAAPKAPIIQIGDRQRFRDKVVLITGATSGIGAAAAKMFAGEGAKVGFCGRREDRGRQVEAEIHKGGGTARYIRADVRIADDVERFVIRWRTGTAASTSASTTPA